MLDTNTGAENIKSNLESIANTVTIHKYYFRCFLQVYWRLLLL